MLVEERLTAKNINDRDAEYSSLLHISVAQKNAERVELLLARRIDVNLQNAKGNTALAQALATSAPQRIIDLLVRAPTANIDLQNKASAPPPRRSSLPGAWCHWPRV